MGLPILQTLLEVMTGFWMSGVCRMLFPVFLAILIFLFGSKVIYAAENTEKEADRVQEALFEEFDFSKLDQEMKTLFPDEKLSFREILMQLISENGGSTGWYRWCSFIKVNRFFNQFGTNKKILVYMILIAVAAALFNNFTSVFQNRQVSSQLLYSLYAAYDPVTCNFFSIRCRIQNNCFLI